MEVSRKVDVGYSTDLAAVICAYFHEGQSLSSCMDGSIVWIDALNDEVNAASFKDILDKTDIQLDSIEQPLGADS